MCFGGLFENPTNFIILIVYQNEHERRHERTTIVDDVGVVIVAERSHEPAFFYRVRERAEVVLGAPRSVREFTLERAGFDEENEEDERR